MMCPLAPPTLRAIAAILSLAIAGAADAPAQPASASHLVPVGTAGNAVDLTVTGLTLTTANVTVAVASAPEWVSVTDQPVEIKAAAEGTYRARIPFDLPFDVEIGQRGDLILLVLDPNGRSLATRTIALEVGNPTDLLLAAPVPNPFQSRTTLRFTVPRSSDVTLTVLDVLGRQVAILVDEEVQAGVHTVQFDGRSLASGRYVVRLLMLTETGSQTAVRSLTIAR